MARSTRLSTGSTRLSTSSNRVSTSSRKDGDSRLRASYQSLLMDSDDDSSPLAELDAEQRGLSCASCRDCSTWVLSSLAWQVSMAVLIVLNAALMGFESDNVDDHRCELMEMFFLLVFTLELCAKVISSGWSSFCSHSSPEHMWDMFDTCIVVSGWAAAAYSWIGQNLHTGGGIATVFRLLRLARILRIFRLVRLAKRLYVLAYGFMLAAVAIFWVTVLMVSGLYVCAIVLVRTVGRTPEDEVGGDVLQTRFGTLREAMYTLFELAVKPNLKEFQEGITGRPLLMVFLSFFIIFGSFGMIALLTGVISEAMFVKNVAKLEEERLERQFMVRDLALAAAEIFDSVVGLQGEASKDDLSQILPRARDILDAYGLVTTEEELAKILRLADTDCSGSIDRTEFCRGILQIAEDVRPALVMELHYDSMAYFKGRMDAWDRRMYTLISQNANLRQQVAAVAASLGDPFKVEPDTSGAPKEMNGGPLLRLGDTVAPAAANTLSTAGGPTKADLRTSAADLRGQVQALRSTMEGLGVHLDTVAGDLRHQGPEAASAVQLNSAGLVAGVSRRVGECEFAVKRACGAIAAVSQQNDKLNAQIQAMVSELPPIAS